MPVTPTQPSPSTPPSVLTSWGQTVVRLLEASGIDPAPVLRQAGYPAQISAAHRATSEQSRRLWQAARAITGDSAVGVRAARYVVPTTFHALGYAVLASTSLDDAFRRFARYARFVSDAAEVRFERDAAGAGRLHLSFVSQDGRPADESIDAVFAMMVRCTRLLRGRELAPRAVYFERPRPDASEIFEACFRCPLHFGAADNVLELAAFDLDVPIPTGDAQLAAQNDAVVHQAIAALSKASLRERAAAAVAERLPAGEPDQAEIARALSISVRSLQRRLEEEGTSYREVLQQARLDLARAHLARAECSITETAFLLGFSDTSAFSRAFKRWTGESPSAYRSRHAG